MLDQEFRIEEGYNLMVSGRPSKILSGWSYECQPKPLRSSRTAGEFCETEVSKHKIFKRVITHESHEFETIF